MPGLKSPAIATNTLFLSINYWRFTVSAVWYGGELEFVLPDEKVVRLHGTEWGETQRFYHHLDAHWRRWSGEMSEIASGVLRQQLDLIATRTGENKWLTREQTSGVQQQIRQGFVGVAVAG